MPRRSPDAKHRQRPLGPPHRWGGTGPGGSAGGERIPGTERAPPPNGLDERGLYRRGGRLDDERDVSANPPKKASAPQWSERAGSGFSPRSPRSTLGSCWRWVSGRPAVCWGGTSRSPLLAGLPREWEGRWLVPSIHPASVLRHGNEMTALQTACDVAMNLVGGREPPFGIRGRPPYEVLEPTPRNSTGGVHESPSLPEGTCSGATSKRRGSTPESIRSCPWAVVREEQGHHPPRRGTVGEVRMFVCCWRAAFPLRLAQRSIRRGLPPQAGVRARIDEDTLLLHYCLDEQKGTHDLEQVAARYLGARDYKDEVSAYRKGGWWACPPDVLHRYLARDCDYTRQLVDVLGTEVAADPGLEGLYRSLLLPAADLLTEVSATGSTSTSRRPAGLRRRSSPARKRRSLVCGP
jgi:hypothetical protein